MIIQHKSHLNDIIDKNIQSEVVIIPTLCDKNLHPKRNQLSLLYVKWLSTNDENIIVLNHSEKRKDNDLTLEFVEEALNKNKENKYIFDKKAFNHSMSLNSLNDTNLNFYLDSSNPLYIDNLTTNTHDFFHINFSTLNNINRYIPIMKHLEYGRKLVRKMRDLFFYDERNKNYNENVIDNLTKIEDNGLFISDNGYQYSQYNIYTSTGRPSNRFGGVNFAALNKSDRTREKYVSRYGEKGCMIEMDYDAYHLRLIAEIVDYNFPEGSVHQYLADQYDVDYAKAKSLSFAYLYGEIPYMIYQTIPFFNKVQKYIDKKWLEYKQNNFVVSDIYNRKIGKSLSFTNKSKLFNYCIQLLETENNMRMLDDLLPLLEGKKTKLILYSYDSFLLDFHKDDGMDFLKKIKKVIEQNDTYPVKVGWGINYHKMEDITEKFND
jgi:hypothetical protein